MIYEFAATQDLHGYSKPWAPGANINKLPPPSSFSPVVVNELTITPYPDGSYHANKSGTTGAASVVVPLADSIDITTSEYYTNLSTASATGAFPINLFDSLGQVIEGSYIGKASTLISNEGTVVSIQFYTAPSWTGDANIYPMISDDPVTVFSPYSNICPPEGFNIWDPTNQEYIQVYAGYVNANTRELYLRPVYEEYAGEELVGPWMSSLDEYSEDATPTEGAFVIDFGGELTSYEITPFMLQTLLDSLGIRQHFTDGAGLLNKLMDQAQGRVRSEEELLHLSRPLKVIPIGDQLPTGLTFKPISKDVLPGLPGKFIR